MGIFGPGVEPGAPGDGTGWQENIWGRGDGPGEDDDPCAPDAGGEAPNIFAKRASLYTQMAMLTAVVERNLAGPGVTVE